MIRRPPRSTLSSSSAASDVYKRQLCYLTNAQGAIENLFEFHGRHISAVFVQAPVVEPVQVGAWTTRPVIHRSGGHGISRFSRMKAPRMPWFSDRAGSTKRLAIAPPAVLPSAFMTAWACLLYTSPSPRDGLLSRMPS